MYVIHCDVVALFTINQRGFFPHSFHQPLPSKKAILSNKLEIVRIFFNACMAVNLVQQTSQLPILQFNNDNK